MPLTRALIPLICALYLPCCCSCNLLSQADPQLNRAVTSMTCWTSVEIRYKGSEVYHNDMREQGTEMWMDGTKGGDLDRRITKSRSLAVDHVTSRTHPPTTTCHAKRAGRRVHPEYDTYSLWPPIKSAIKSWVVCAPPPMPCCCRCAGRSCCIMCGGRCCCCCCCWSCWRIETCDMCPPGPPC